MPGLLRKEIQQNKPFAHPADEAFLSLQRTAGLLLDGVEQTLKPWQLSHPQYNILRILRGAGLNGMPCGAVAERLVTRDPDITRLLDRMEKRGLVRRTRAAEDRRVVLAFLAEEGERVLAALDKPVRDAVRAPLAGLGKDKLALLIDLLEEVRIQMEVPASD